MSGKTILVVEDQQSLLDAYDRILSKSYDVRPAATRAEAMEVLDESIDVALLDRRLPDGRGEDVLREIQTRNIDCYVAMVTAVDPDFDIIDFGLDDYLVKPVAADEINAAVERLLALAEYDETYRELSQKRVTKSVLEHEKSAAELESSAEFARLQQEIERLEAALASKATECSDVKRPLQL